MPKMSRSQERKLRALLEQRRTDLAPALYTESKHSRSDGTELHRRRLSDGGMGERLKIVMEFDS